MDIKEVIHLYLGCDFLYRVIDVEKEQSRPMKLTADQLSIFYQLVNDPNCEYKPILRRLSSMTEEEAIQLYNFLFPTVDRKDSFKVRTVQFTTTRIGFYGFSPNTSIYST